MTDRVNFRRFFAALGIAIFAIPTAANATVHRVFPGQSIQGAIDAAAPGDTVLVEPGTYTETFTATGGQKYGLRISKDNLRLIGKVKPGQGNAGKVRILYDGLPEDGTVGAGVYAAPEGCDFNVSADSDLGKECNKKKVRGFYIRGFTVENFPVNGIQTRWVDGFEFVRNESVNNLNNGIYPTLSANGLVQNNVSYGSLDTAMWVAGSENVRVIGNELFGSTIGFEITVANNVRVTHNKIYGNTVGVGLFHPNAAGNPPTDVMANWVIEQNEIYDNNLQNPAVPGTFQAGVPPGVGVLLLGVSDHVIAKNVVRGNDFAGIAVLGWCTAVSLGDPARNCQNAPPIRDPSANNNRVSENKLSGNGGNPPPIGLPGVDILYVQTPPFEPGTGNCFEKNKPSTFTFFSSELDGELPTDGCKQSGPKKK
jgi:parallel beta-helix repeat protein